MKQTLIWTALPNGFTTVEENKYLRVSVFVSPRLSASTQAEATGLKLTSFPDFQDWPAKLRDLQFSVHFVGRGDRPAQRVAPPGDPPPSNLWKALFQANQWVKSYEDPPLNNLTFVSFPVANLHARIRETYQTISVESPDKLPALDQTNPVLPLLKELAITPQASATVLQNLQGRAQIVRPGAGAAGVQAPQVRAFTPPPYRSARKFRAGTPAPAAAAQASPVLPNVSAAKLDFHQIQAFHTPVATGALPKLTPALLAGSMDFHRIVSSLGQFPDLMRRLGLVIDLLVPFEAALAGANQIKVVVAFSSATQTQVSTPRTRVTLTATVFQATPEAGSDLEAGQLKLNDPDRFDVGQTDVDGTALKLINVANNISAEEKRVTPQTPAPATPPPGGGRPVALAGRTALMPHAATFSKLGAIPTLAAAKPPEAALPALRSSGLWVARIDRVKQVAAKLALTVANNLKLAKTGGAPDEVTLDADDLIRGYRPDVWDETAQRWYSLCRRQGVYLLTRLGNRTLHAHDEGWIGPLVTHPETNPSQYHVHEALFRWEGWSLCAPRPGKAVKGDNSAPPETGKFGLDTSFTPAPGTLPRLRFGRTYRLRARAVDLAGNSLPLDEAGEDQATEPITFFRAEPVPPPVVIPRVSLEKAPGESVRGLVIRSQNDTPEKDKIPANSDSHRHLAPPRTSQQLAEWHGMFDNPADGVRGGQQVYNLIANREKSPPPFADVATFEIPYLPDPLAAGVILRLKPEPFAAQPQEQVLKVPFTGNWPSIRGFRVVLYEAATPGAKMEYNAPNNAVRIPLAKGDAATLEVSCYLKPEDLKLMEVWRWTTEHFVAPLPKVKALPAPDKLKLHREMHDLQALPQWSAKVSLPQPQVAKLQSVGQLAQNGRHWMITPPVMLTLLHATQQPLGQPAYQSLQSLRHIGETFSTISARLAVSGKSAGRVDLEATWEEPTDPLAKPAPEVLRGQQTVGQLHLERPHTQVTMTPRHEFGDTKYRRVNYRVVETSRFRECFSFTEAQLSSGAVSMTRSVEQGLDVLSSARPLAPKVLYVIPTFTWSEDRAGNKVTSKRTGGGLRIYLERPWFSSGAGEQLGVVLPPAAATRAAVPIAFTGQANVSEVLRPFVTQWGADPLWRTQTLPRLLLNPDDFVLANNKEADLTLDELPGGPRVRVAGHPVAYDTLRQLWYCDVQLSPGASYFPFIRLALARYQPNSIKDATGDVKLSRVVLADFAQLAPDRTAVVTRDPANKSKLSLSVSGPSYVQSALGRLPDKDLAQVEVTLEVQDPALVGAVAWSAVPETVFPLKLTTVALGGNVWTGDLTLPGTEAGQKYRLVIREYEIFQADPQQAPAAVTALTTTHGRRLVYAAVVEL